MSAIPILLRVLHVTFAALWFAYPLGATRVLRRSLDAEPGHLRSLAAELLRRSKLASIMGVLTLFSGVAIILHMGGFAVVPKQLHHAILLVFLMVILNLSMGMRSARKIVAEAAKESPSSEAMGAPLKAYAKAAGIQHLLWVATLLLMFLR